MRSILPVAVFLSFAVTTAVSGQGAPAPDSTSADTTVSVSYGGFVDSYYAYDFNRPENMDRSYTTQPARHNEFNVNLAYIEAKASGPRLRGRLALQAGTSVQSNYAGEPAVGSVSGPSVARFIQEAVAGYKLTPSLWIDAGIFLSHIGMESFISRDNLTYTRSLSADYTPYYESGAKLSFQASPRLNAVLVVMNGWQNISENNKHKAVGLRLDFAQSSSTSLVYHNFLGKENSDGLLRFFNGIGLKASLRPDLIIQAHGDYGVQDKPDDDGQSTWYSAALIAKLQPTPMVGVSARVETYHDPDQVIVVTGTSEGFKGTTASFGVDVTPLGSNRAMWRNEVRGSWTSDRIFPSRSASGLSKDNILLVTSLGVTF